MHAHAIMKTCYSKKIDDFGIILFKIYWSTCVPTRNSPGDEIANVNFLYDDIIHALDKKLSYRRETALQFV